VGGIFIRDDNTGNSGVTVISVVGVRDEVCVGSGEGESVSLGLDSTGDSDIETLAALTDVDVHPLSSAAASVKRRKETVSEYRDTASMTKNGDITPILSSGHRQNRLFIHYLQNSKLLKADHPGGNTAPPTGYPIGR
jgi:hypothetical protein